MAKPTNTIDWTPDPGDIVEPAAGDKLVGFAPGFRPPAQWFNWFWELVTQWIVWLDVEVPAIDLSTPQIAPTALAVDTDDYAPTGIDTARTIRQDLSADVVLTGLTDGSEGRQIKIVNVNATFALTLSHEDAGSTAANRFALPRGRALILRQYEYALIRYDGTASRWLLTASSGKAFSDPWIPASDGLALAGNFALNSFFHAATTSATDDQTWGVPITIEPGSIITAIRTRVAFAQAVAETARIALVRIRDATVEYVDDVVVPNNGAVPTTIEGSITAHTIVDTWQYYVVGEVNNVGASTNIVFQGFGYDVG